MSLAALFAILSASTIAASREAPAPATPRLVILAPEAFVPGLAEFVRHKKAEGLAVTVSALEKVLKESPGGDDPERVKHFLHAAWRDGKARYALLVGDADVFPVRYMVLDRCTPEAFDYAFYPSDLYYADLARPDGSFDDWNAAKDGFHGRYFGEVRGEKNKDGPINHDRIDYRPEIGVGRWPVNTIEEVRTAAAKTIAFEEAAARGAIPPRAAFFCVSGWIDARRGLDAVAAKLPAGWTPEKRYFADPGGAPATPPPTEAEVVSLLDGGVPLLFHAGHGQDLGWDGCFGAGTAAKLRNAAPAAILMSIGCSTARFATLPPYEAYEDESGVEHRGTNGGEVFGAPPPPPAPYARGRFNPPGLGEILVRSGPAGAVAYIGCNTGGQPCALTLLDGLVTAFGEAPAGRLGDHWARALALYFERERLATLAPDAGWYPPSIFFQGMKYMLFGDPSLRMPGPAATDRAGRAPR